MTQYTVRLVTRVRRDIDARLRLLAAVRRQPVAHVLCDVLAGALPSADDLADEIRKGRAADVDPR